MVTPRIPQPVQLTSLDFDMAFERMTELVGSLYPWLDLENRAELARMHLEAMAHLSGHFHYYLNRIGRESRWGTAVERTNLLALLKLVNYRPRTASAAHTTERFTLASAAAANVVIPAGTVVRTLEVAEPVRFQTLAELVIPAGETVGEAQAENSETIAETYISDGTPFQRFRLGSSPYLDGSMQISTPLGTWSEVTNFLRSNGNDRHFVTTIDSQERVTVVFGNNRSGAIPTSPIQFTYKIGGGVAGRLPAGALVELEGSISDVNGDAVTVTVTNPSATTGGDARESDAEIKVNAPAFVEVAQRAVSRSDYERAARQVPGVAFALMLTRNEDPAVLENEGFLFVVPDDGGTASNELLTSVASLFGDNVAVGSGGVYVALPEGPTPKTTTFQLRVRPAAYKVIDVYAKVFMRKGYRAATVQAAVETAYSNYFAPLVEARSIGINADGLVPNPRVNFGYYLQDVDGVPTGHFPLSDIKAMLVATTGVRELGDGPLDVRLNDEPRNVDLARYEFPKAGTVNLLLL
jgi:hypothetical protein